MSGYQRVRIEFTGWTSAEEWMPKQYWGKAEPAPNWRVKCLECGNLWPEWFTWSGLKDAYRQAIRHWRDCPALRLQRLIADLEADAERAEYHSRDCDNSANKHTDELVAIHWAAAGQVWRKRAADMRALVARHRAAGGGA